MPLFKLEGQKLKLIKEDRIKMEHDIQSITEKNLDEIFGLEFVRSEFTIKNFRIDTLAFDPSTRSFVIIEYKRDKSSSIVDQGLAYLDVMLNNKGEFIVEYNESMNKNIKRNEFDWTQSRVIFIAQSYNEFQKKASGFKDLPIELWKVELFENGTISYNRITAPKGIASIKTVYKDKRVKNIVKEVKTYTVEDHFNPKWDKTKRIYERLKEHINSMADDIEERVTKYYIAYVPQETNRSFVEIVIQKQGVKVYLRPKVDKLKTTHFELQDCSEIGHWTNGNTSFVVKSEEDIPYAIELIRQAMKLN